MKRVLVSASILAAFLTTAAGPATADAQPSRASQPIADSGSSVLSPELVVTINQALLWLANGSSEPCTAPAGLCPPR
ncbi:hypothetical protein [Nocardia sp. NPDC051833]|uniref:hypothetical protein n=1 Tax=Nocardia sp. NPDC051833 TaxID=3155674 RepID=UPI003442EC6A